MDRTEFPRGGGRQKTIKKIGGLDLRQHHFFFLPDPPPETENILKNQKGKYARKWNRTILMRPHVLKGIYAERSKWETEIQKHQQSTTAAERTQTNGLSKGMKTSGGNHMRVRASGEGAKQQFPHLVGEVKTWLER